jgi:hypothetical protein
MFKKINIEDVKDNVFHILAFLFVVPLFYVVVCIDWGSVKVKEACYIMRKIEYHKIPSKFGYYVGRKD